MLIRKIVCSFAVLTLSSWAIASDYDEIDKEMIVSRVKLWRIGQPETISESGLLHRFEHSKIAKDKIDTRETYLVLDDTLIEKSPASFFRLSEDKPGASMELKTLLGNIKNLGVNLPDKPLIPVRVPSWNEFVDNKLVSLYFTLTPQVKDAASAASDNATKAQDESVAITDGRLNESPQTPTPILDSTHIQWGPAELIQTMVKSIEGDSKVRMDLLYQLHYRRFPIEIQLFRSTLALGKADAPIARLPAHLIRHVSGTSGYLMYINQDNSKTVLFEIPTLSDKEIEFPANCFVSEVLAPLVSETGLSCKLPTADSKQTSVCKMTERNGLQEIDIAFTLQALAAKQVLEFWVRPNEVPISYRISFTARDEVVSQQGAEQEVHVIRSKTCQSVRIE